jgi:hypothetical protein
MADIKSWANTAAANNQQPPDGWPENQLPSTVNDCAREDMAAVRRFYETSQWTDLGHVLTYLSATTFKIPTDLTATYVPGRRLKLTDTTTLYGVVVSSAYSAPDTTITVRLDSGSLSSSLSACALSVLTPDNNSIPSIFPFSSYAAITGTTTIVLGDCGRYFDATSGTFTVTLPAANVRTSVNPPFVVTIGNSGAGTITVARAGSDTIDGATSFTLTQYQVVTLISNGSNAWRRINSFGV